MKKFSRLLVVALCFFIPLFSHTVSRGEYFPVDEGEPANMERAGFKVSGSEFKGRAGERTEAQFDQFKKPGTGRGLEELNKPAEHIGKETLQQPERKGKIFLSAEPGDTVISLSWKPERGTDTSAGQPLRYAISYGTESGKFDKRLEVGSAREYRLRGLQNHQLYFIRIEGATKDNQIFLFSDEVRAAPLPEKELASPLEKSFSSATVTLQDRREKIEADSLMRNLRQFGYDFFRNSAPRDFPNENIPVGSDYTIGSGDSLRIDMWGTVNARFELEVDRNGEIAIPKVGVVKVWGLTYSQVREAIDRAVSRYFKGYELNVSLGRLRTIQVFVVGEVESPGSYHVSSMGTVINAVSMAGGPSKNGSLRSIRLSRGGKVVQEIDLYAMFLAGDRSGDFRLENGDTIFVPVIGQVAAVVGEVKRPAIYELKGKTTLPELLAMAGGITAAGYTGRIQVERFEGNSSRIVIDETPKSSALDEAFAGVEARDRDLVKVFPINKALRQVITLRGNVARPGEYQFTKGMRLTDLMPGYDALLPDSWLDSAEITRLIPPDYHREVLTVDLKRAFEGDQKENIHLQEQDTILVFSRGEKEEKRTVAINGQVVSPGTFDYFPNMTVRDLVTQAGSPKWNASLDSAELTRIVVEQGRASSTRRIIDLGKALAGDPENNLILQPNDVLIVRGIVDWLEAKERFVVLTGEVRYPGTYSIAKGERLSSVIERAGGFTDKAYLKGAKFTRVSVKENQQERMSEVIARTELDLLKKEAELSSLAASREELEATKTSLEGLLKTLEKLKAVRAEGRVVIHLASLDEFKRTPYDIEMMGGDTLEIPLKPNVVNVMGQVYNSTTLIYMPEQKLSYYLQKAGGPTRDAAEGEMYVVKANGTVLSREQSSFGIRWDDEGKQWTFGSFMSASLDPGDTLVVPQQFERIAWMREIKDITTILSQIALTAGVIIAAGL